jgi:cytosine/adenosine deaminase-related metal-dependent hydrolase
MPERFDILIKRARLRGRPDQFLEIGVAAGRVAAMEEHVDGTAEVEIDAQGNLVTESFANPHLHLCKVYTLQMMDEEGVLVCLGQDDISDAYYPYGRNNMLEVAFLASHLLWMTATAEMEMLYDMITVCAAQAMGLRDFALKVGAPAHLVVLDGPNVLETLRYHAPPAHVISHGKLVDQSRMHALL